MSQAIAEGGTRKAFLRITQIFADKKAAALRFEQRGYDIAGAGVSVTLRQSNPVHHAVEQVQHQLLLQAMLQHPSTYAHAVVPVFEPAAHLAFVQKGFPSTNSVRKSVVMQMPVHPQGPS